MHSYSKELLTVDLKFKFNWVFFYPATLIIGIPCQAVID